MRSLFSSIPKITDTIILLLEGSGSEGMSTKNLNIETSKILGVAEEDIAGMLKDTWVSAQLQKGRKKLKENAAIGFNTKTRVWYVIKERKAPSTREKRFIEKTLGAGWKRVESTLIAIEWIYKNFTPDQFENFCSAIFADRFGVDMKVTEKRPFSGADGGFDAMGTFPVDGKLEKVILQAKRYALSAQVGQNHCHSLIGAMVDNDINHAFIITTSIFSERAMATIKNVKKKDIWIEPVDQKVITNIMLYREDHPHGFGLHQTDIGWYYMNEDILRNAGDGVSE